MQNEGTAWNITDGPSCKYVSNRLRYNASLKLVQKFVTDCSTYEFGKIYVEVVES